MTLRDHLKIINDSVMLEVLDNSEVVYKGWKGCFEYDKEAVKALDREIISFALRVDARGRHKPDTGKRTVITELNCGKFNYCDLYIDLVYSYKLANK